MKSLNERQQTILSLYKQGLSPSAITKRLYGRWRARLEANVWSTIHMLERKGLVEGDPKMKLCPRCKLPKLHEDDALDARSHDGKTVICTLCGQIESYEKFAPHLAQGLKVGQRREQAARYGLDEHGNPKLPRGNATI